MLNVNATNSINVSSSTSKPPQTKENIHRQPQNKGEYSLISRDKKSFSQSGDIETLFQWKPFNVLKNKCVLHFDMRFRFTAGLSRAIGQLLTKETETQRFTMFNFKTQPLDLFEKIASSMTLHSRQTLSKGWMWFPR